MKKILILVVVVIIGLIIISAIGSVISNPATKEAFNKGQQDAKKALDTPKATKHAVIADNTNDSGKPYTGDVDVWNNPGTGGITTVKVGSVPLNTKIEIVESKVVDGGTFYNIRSTIGKVSMLPTDLGMRKKAMDTKPQSEWYENADASFPVEGWVSGNFVKNIE